jgi:vitamin B12/bleomycin/antimicrobial peptide transport system ATP-binding/permease protein
MRLTQNAEGIAFHAGEAEQEKELMQRFAAILDNWRSIMSATLRLTFLTSSYAQLILVFPLAVVAPAYFAGRLSLGGIFQTANAFVQVQTALSWIVQSYADLTAWLATVQRLGGFQASVAKMTAWNEGPSLIANQKDQLELSGVNLSLPDGRILFQEIYLQVERGERLLIQGASGVGKSTLLRSIAGIWPFGSGEIKYPPGRHLFIPQKPYMPLGSLKRAACFPFPEASFTDDQVVQALNDAKLGHLVADLGKTDVWEQRLSGGELQRLSMARVLLVRPDWLFLDEATSALDMPTDAALYELLLARLGDSTLISVSHGTELNRFHDRRLSVERGMIRDSP